MRRGKRRRAAVGTPQAAPRRPPADGYGTAAACALAAFAVYLRTLPPTVTGEDSGELVVAAYTLGIPHPPGYPLWCLVTHLFTYLPFGTVAWRVTLGSAAFAAATVFVIGVIVARLTASRAGVAAGALGLAFSRELWEQASIAEVYALNAFVTSICLYLLIRWYAERRDVLLYVFAVVVGLGMGVHHTMMVLAVPFAAFVLAVDHGRRALRQVYPRCVLLAVVPLAVYAYLPLRSAANPPVDWGDPETWSRFWAVVSRRQFAYVWTRYPRTLERFVSLVIEFLRQYGVQFTFAVAPLPAIGLWALWRRDRGLAAFLGGLFVYIGLAFVVITNFEATSRWERIQFGLFWLPAWVTAAVLLGMGVARLGELPRGRVVAAALAVLVPAVVFLRHFRAADKSEYWFAYDFGRNVLVTMEPGALFFPRGDHRTFPALYLQAVDRMRPDVLIADKYGYPEPRLLAGMPPELRHTPLTKEQLEYWIFTHTDRPIYIGEQRPIPEEIGTLVPAGVLYRLVRPGESWQEPADLWDRYEWHTLDPRAAHGNWSAEAILSDVYYSLGRHRLAAGDVSGARAAFDDVLLVGGENVVDLSNIGGSFVERQRWPDATEFLERALRVDPHYVPALKNLIVVWTAQGDCRRALVPLDELARLGAATTEESALRTACRAELGVR